MSRHMKRFLRIEIGVTGIYICMVLHRINTHHLSFIMLLRYLYSQVPNQMAYLTEIYNMIFINLL